MYQYLLQIIVIGSENVGKKTLAKSRFFPNSSDLDYMLTIGIEIQSKMVEIYNTKAKLSCFIMNHEQRYWDNTKEIYLGVHVRNSKGAIIMYDITNPKALEQISHWIQLVKNNTRNIPIFLAGNKLDLEEQRKISKEQVEKIKVKHGISSSMDISVKTGENVEKLFLKLTSMILNSNKMEEKRKYFWS